MSENRPEATIRIEWDGEHIDIPVTTTKVIQAAAGHYLIESQNGFNEVFVKNGKISDGSALDQIEIRIESERERIIRERFQDQAGGGGGATKSGNYLLKAPMPGLVRALSVAVGDKVEKNTTVLVLEAMKMENNIGAGAKGVVAKINVREGQSVEKNSALIEISHG